MTPCPTWDGESYCVEEGCTHIATHERFEGFTGDDFVVELVCCGHEERNEP